MTDKLVALLGTGDGPRLYVGRMHNVVARIANLQEGDVVVIHDQGSFVVSENGEAALPTTKFVQFSHAGKSKNLICTLLSKPNALHSP